MLITTEMFIAPTLEMFFRQIINFYETKQKDKFDEYFEVEEIENYPIKFILK